MAIGFERVQIKGIRISEGLMYNQCPTFYVIKIMIL